MVKYSFAFVLITFLISVPSFAQDIADPICSINLPDSSEDVLSQSRVIEVSDGTNNRCASVVIPDVDEADQKLPILFDFHGAGGNAANYPGNKSGLEGSSWADIAADGQFALVGGEALQFTNDDRRLQDIKVTPDCVECFVDAGCLKDMEKCSDCMDKNRDNCARSCMPAPFPYAKEAICGKQEDEEDKYREDKEDEDDIARAWIGGLWQIPEVQNDETGIVCDWENNVDLLYITAVLEELETMEDSDGNLLFDTDRVFVTGCSMGSAFTIFVTQCLHQQNPDRVSAFATLGTGLKVKGDGNNFPGDAGECDDCKYFPAPVVPTEGLKLCIDNGDRDPSEQDPYFYRSQLALEQAWRDADMVVETNYHDGFHCQALSFDWMAECLDDGTGRLIKGNDITCTLVRFKDSDGDGFGNPDIFDNLCEETDGWVTDSSDCDDSSADRYPGNTEVCDELDNDCDELVDDDDDDVDELSKTTFYFDADGDRFGDATLTRSACQAPEDYVVLGTDCNDEDADQYPGAECTWTSPADPLLQCESTMIADEGACVCQSADDDSDGVCNAVDKCPGEDDNLDENEDGIPDCQEDVCEPMKKKWEDRRLYVKKGDSRSTTMEFEFPAYNVYFIVDSVNARWGRYDDQVTVSYLTVDGDKGELSMTGSELRKINWKVWGKGKDDWHVDLGEEIGEETGISLITVTLSNAETGRWARASRVYLKAVKFCGNEVEDVIRPKPRKLEDDLD